ncbi:ABC transporter G family member 22-like [Haliotis rubra]|uniref:ABC transporter G family member 22-like n=1 Tax=Haliotis rubra TaxID=36100 RepID=UPI001EE60EF2|nr:ABC transporter G family member 22-like [Haliotis rubra]
MKTSPQVELSFKDIYVTIDAKEILTGVTGKVHSGEILAVMGPSGSGKTTLLNSVAGRIVKTSGEITLNGDKLTRRLRKRMCYVTQEDAFFCNLTLRETLYFAAMIQLPEKMCHQEKMSRLQDILDALDLNDCKDTIMGSAVKRGLSGGEKKRASIGCELLMDPDVMLLDEPTTGLDASLACDLMSLLKRYTCNYNKTVLVTIHQPSSRMYYMFTRLMLLTKGKVAYFGQADQALDFFADAGLPCTPHCNPADFMLEVLKQDSDAVERLFSRTQENTSRNAEVIKSGLFGKTDVSSADQVHPKLPVSIKTGQEAKFVFTPDLDPDLYPDLHHGRRYPTSFWMQYKMHMWRTYKQSRGRILSLHSVIGSLALAVIVGIIWFQIPRTADTVRDRMGLLYFGIGHMGFITIFDGLLSFSEERPVQLKERGAGMYRLSSLYLAKITSELPLTFLLPVCYFAITYWMAGLRPLADVFFASMAVMFLHILNCKGIGFMIGPGIWKLQLAITVTSSTMVSLLMLGGFYNTLMPPWLFWSRYLSVFGHTLSAVLILEFADLTPIPCSNVTLDSYPQCGRNGTDFVTADVVLERVGTVLPMYMYIIANTVTLIVYFSVGYAIFRVRGKPKS